jgi:hypothetical protein
MNLGDKEIVGVSQHDIFEVVMLDNPFIWDIQSNPPGGIAVML